MDEENRTFPNSPIIQRNTPIKRLGLSRKRKSSGSGNSPNAKIQVRNEKFSVSSNQSEKLLLEKPTIITAESSGDTQPINYDEEIDKLKKQISEDEEKLKNLKSYENNITQLEDLIELWRNGCKNAFLHFSQLLKERQLENIDFKAVLSRLGVWETMIANFENDPELSLSEYSQ